MKSFCTVALCLSICYLKEVATDENDIKVDLIEEKTENVLKGYLGKPITKISLTATSGDINIEK